MNDHNLDDLIIDTIEPNQHNKVKSLLTIVALAIVVLIVAIILTKILLKDPNEDKLLFEENETEMISPDLTLQSITEPKEEIAKPTTEPLAEPAKETAVENLDEETISPEPTPEPDLESEEKTQEPIESTQNQTSQTEPEKKVEEPTQKAPIAITHKPKVEEEKPKVESQKVVEEVKPKKIEVRQEPVKAPQHTIENTVQKPVTRPLNVLTRPNEVARTTSTSSVASGTHFIQVGSFSSMPSQLFLDTIKNNGFTYTTIDSNGAKKLLIGPYSSRPAAEAALSKARDRINKNAFIYTK